MKKRGVLVMQNVVLGRPVEDIATYETKVAVYGTAGAAEEGPGSVGVVGKLSVGVVEECDSNWIHVSQWCILRTTRFQLGDVESQIRSNREELTNPVVSPQPRCSIK
jgi:hypothetical protein